jgi:hypothetical protein
MERNLQIIQNSKHKQPILRTENTVSGNTSLAKQQCKNETTVKQHEKYETTNSNN